VEGAGDPMTDQPLIPASRLMQLSDYARRLRERPLSKLTINAAKSIAGTLGHPSKMPGFSYGLHAKLCRTGSAMVKVPGSVCAGCFALKGYYATWWPALIARDRRHAGLNHPWWIDAMVTLIKRYCHGTERHFRWHDSGDLQGTWHLANIVEVAWRTPDVVHWLPTREYGDVLAYVVALSGRSLDSLRIDAELGLYPPHVFPDNLTIRLSSLMIDSEPVIAVRAPGGMPTIDPAISFLPMATVNTPGVGKLVEGKTSIECKAIEARGNICGPCRACWDRRVRCVSYPEH
jgi:hypothetical protein